MRESRTFGSERGKPRKGLICLLNALSAQRNAGMLSAWGFCGCRHLDWGENHARIWEDAANKIF